MLCFSTVFSVIYLSLSHFFFCFLLFSFIFVPTGGFHDLIIRLETKVQVKLKLYFPRMTQKLQNLYPQKNSPHFKRGVSILFHSI